MQNAPAAVGPVSQPNYFEVFGIARRFGVDRLALEKRFYELSRQNHPDRFTQADPAAQRQALEKMSLLNEAYRTLKDPSLLRSYLLQICGVLALGDSDRGLPQGVPLEITEEWFEIQDELLDGNTSALNRVAQIERKIIELQEGAEQSIRSLEVRIDKGAANSEALLIEISSEIRSQSYLKSMLRDVGRMKAKFSSAGT